ncbi:DMT family transporter [Saccharopolyspora dendranthemae]|uniref:Drug/metabolite transporter (DMT)-like permease n=1 Tax=Saccharopolyspora dendranthemae TaxID=1181886 RepID=A0A561VB97_9PSEU|nr:DMT family transporter [Saccharopolyspora dendranthemae]TWG08880.1 drug/metabolite transporter (DMT)-like permease [Saccharopolyspora dendranthemae]
MHQSRSIPLSLAAPIVFFWASGYPTGALGVAAAPPFLLTAVRLALAAAVLAVIALAGGAVWPTGRGLGHCAAAGLLTHATQFGGCYGGMAAGVPASVTALVISMNPVLTAALAAALLRERLSRWRLLGLGLGVLAVLVTLGGQVAAEGEWNPAILLTLLGLLGFSAGGLYQQRYCGGIDIRSGAAAQTAAAAVVIGVIALFEHGHVTHWAQAGAAVLWLVITGSVLGVSCYLRAVAVGGAARASALFSAVPPFTAVLAWPLLGETPSLAAVLGIALATTACVLGTRAETRQPTLASTR